jgi:hypothetical protein
VGNFEIVRYIAGSYDVPDGLHARPEVGATPPGGGPVQRALVVWVEPPLAGLGARRVGCRLFNGYPEAVRTLILDEICIWPTADGAPLRFAPREAFSSYEVSVWGEDGRLVARQEHSVLRGIEVEMQIPDPSRAAKPPWDEKLPAHLQRLVAEATAWSAQHVAPNDYQHDPWVPATNRKRVLLRGLASSTGGSEFFEASNDEHVRAVLFLTGQSQGQPWRKVGGKMTRQVCSTDMETRRSPSSQA